jgi:hypothetical protein
MNPRNKALAIAAIPLSSIVRLHPSCFWHPRALKFSRRIYVQKIKLKTLIIQSR